MDMTIGKRIGLLRKEKGLTQEELASHMGVSPQAVSKWENDQTCPDISALPKLARLFDVTVDELLEGKEVLPAARVLRPAERKDPKDMLLRITVDSAQGDRVRVNLPIALVEIGIEIGMEMPQINGNEALKGIDLKKVLEMVRMGCVGNLVEVDSADGDKVRIFVEESMIIKIRSNDGPNLFIPFPTGLLCNRLTAGFAAKAMEQNGWSATPAQMVRFFRAVRRYKRKHPDWVLTEVQSSNGDYVYVKL